MSQRLHPDDRPTKEELLAAAVVVFALSGLIWTCFLWEVFQ